MDKVKRSRVSGYLPIPAGMADAFAVEVDRIEWLAARLADGTVPAPLGYPGVYGLRNGTYDALARSAARRPGTAGEGC